MSSHSSRPAPRVCILTETFHPVVGGGETQAKSLGEGLADSDMAVIVITRRSDPAYPAIEQMGPILIHRLPPTGRHHLKKWVLLLTCIPALLRLRRRYDIIFVSGFRVLGVSAVVVGKLLGKKIILKADSMGEMSGAFFEAGLARFGKTPSSHLFRMILRIRNQVLRRADYFVAISTAIAEELRQHRIGRTRLIPNSVDTAVFVPADASSKIQLRRKLELPATATIVTYTGRLVSYKGLPLLLAVWRELHSRYSGLLLLLVGAGGLDIHSCEGELKRFVRQHKLEKSVTFTGNVRNISDYLRASDIFVLPTENEAFGISLVEAMACGLPVVSTTVGGVKDILHHLENGLLVAPNDKRELANALELLINDKDLADRLGASARVDTLERFSTEMVTQQYVKLFEETLRGSRTMPTSIADRI